MADIDAVLAANRAAIHELIAAAEATGAAWTSPRAPGKWSPSQLVEHVARTLEESANVVSGAPSNFPALPAFARPLVRALFFSRTLKRGVFPKSKTIKALDPIRGPETCAQAKPRLEEALARFDQACRQRIAGGLKVNSTVFGSISVEDYARFQELHTRHHVKQVSAPA